MKIKQLPLLVLTSAFSLLTTFLHSQGTWTQKADFGGLPLSYAGSFSTGGKGYVVAGDKGTMTKELWGWDKQTNTWQQRLDFAGTARIYAACFSIGNAGYIGTGWDGSLKKDFWEWNEFSNVWTQKADFAGTARRNAVGFAIGAKGYIGTGYDGAYKQDLWEYNPISNTWAQKANFPGAARSNAVALTISGKGYMGTGQDASVSYNDFWEYNSSNDQWSQKANFGGVARFDAAAFAIGTRGFIGTGNTGSTCLQDMWQYDAIGNSWTSVASLPAAGRKGAASFSLNMKGYVGTGLDNSSNYLDDLWEYIPACNLTLSVTVANATCGQANGTATVTAGGGSAPYTYHWTNGDVAAQADSLASGLYMITVTDAMGCTQSAPAMISDIGSPSITVTAIGPVSCKGENNGSINISVSSGSAPYTYSWVNGATTQDVSNLSAGPYQVTVYGNNGCMAMANITVTEPNAAVSASVAITHATCGSPNGSATVFPAGGSAPYTYAWSTTPVQTAVTCTGLSAGGYSVTVTDVQGCSHVAMVPVVNSGGAVVAVDSIKAAGCATGLGSIYVSVSSGTAPYTYAWSNGSTAQDLINVPAGPYSLTVYSSGNPCTGAYMGAVPAQLPDAPSICIVTVDTVLNKNICVFEKDTVANPGISHYNFYRESVVAGQYQFLASKPANQLSQWTDQSANPLQHAWRYRISAVDTCGNESALSNYHKTIHLAANIGLNNNVNLLWDDYEGISYSTFIIYRFTWATGWDSLDAVSGNIHAYTDLNPPVPLTDVYYYVAVSNPSGCNPSSIDPQPETSNLNLSKSNINKINPTPTGVHPSYTTPPAVQVYPNPSSGKMILTVNNTSSYGLEVYNVMGEKVYSENRDHAKPQMLDLALPNGIYFLKVISDGGVVTKKIVVSK